MKDEEQDTEWIELNSENSTITPDTFKEPEQSSSD